MDGVVEAGHTARMRELVVLPVYLVGLSQVQQVIGDLG